MSRPVFLHDPRPPLGVRKTALGIDRKSIYLADVCHASVTELLKTVGLSRFPAVVTQTNGQSTVFEEQLAPHALF